MRFSRWLVPATVAATVAGGVVVSSAAAGGAPPVPDRTAAQVLALAASARVDALSGTVRTHADLGLPDLSALGGAAGGGRRDQGDPAGSAADPQAVLTRLLAGRTTLRVWLDGPQHQRVQLLDSFAEVAFVHDGRDVWAFDTGTQSGTHWILPGEADVKAFAEQQRAAHAAAGHDTTGEGTGTADGMAGATGGTGTGADAASSMTPEALAQQVISRLDPTTSVRLDPPQTVAGRAAYTLVVEPRTDATLVDRAVLAVDAKTGLALRAQVYARGHADPVLESGFADIDYARPGASRFAFTPPAGADVTTKTVPLPDAGALPHRDGTSGSSGTGGAAQKDGSGRTAPAARPDVRVVGTGWAAVFVAKPPASGAAGGQDLQGLLSDPMLSQLTTRVENGRALRTALFSVLLTDDGRVLVGAVPVQTLVAAAR